MSGHADRNSRSVAVALFFVALWAVFQFAFPYHLAFKERYVLFLSDASWLSAYFKKPAPLAFLAGDWLTQFFLLRGVAPLVATGLLLLFWDGCRHILKSLGSRHPALWPLIPVAALGFLILFPEVPLAVLMEACLFAWAAAALLRIRSKVLRLSAITLLLVLLVPSVRSLSDTGGLMRPGREREYDYRIYFNACNGKWDRVAQMGLRNPHESLITAYCYNIALARDASLPDGLLKAYQPTYHGLFIPVKAGVECFKLMASTDALYLAGDYAQAQHSAMLGMTFSPRQRSAEMVRALTDIAFANGDYETARRYLGILSRTSMYRRWAREGLRLLDTESDKLVVKNDCKDILVQHNDYRTSLANIAATASDGRTAADYLLCLDLLNKDLDNFRKDYDRLYKDRYDLAGTPVLYQEALLMTFDEDTPPARQLTDYGISRTVLDGVADFLSGKEELFRKSYWFYYKYAQPAQ